MRRMIVAGALAAAVTALAMLPVRAGGLEHAGAGGGGGSVCAGFDDSDVVVMRDSCFEGTAHFTGRDATITIRNDGQLPHTFTAADGSFDSGFVQPGETVSFDVTGDGILRFYCTLHGTASGEGMAGVLLAGELAEASAMIRDGAAAGAGLASPAATSTTPDSARGAWIPWVLLGITVACSVLIGVRLAVRSARSS